MEKRKPRRQQPCKSSDKAGRALTWHSPHLSPCWTGAALCHLKAHSEETAPTWPSSRSYLRWVSERPRRGPWISKQTSFHALCSPQAKSACVRARRLHREQGAKLSSLSFGWRSCGSPTLPSSQSLYRNDHSLHVKQEGGKS